jgi:GT2 family glycosyltransferase
MAKAAVVIVAYRTPSDVLTCVQALEECRAVSDFQAFVIENGGAAAFAATADLLRGEGYAPTGADFQACRENSFVRVESLAKPNGDLVVHLAQAPENLGYAGGINAWLRQIRVDPAWDGFWILNPDTQPERQALAALMRCAEERKKGMIGSRILASGRPDTSMSRGLRWSVWNCRTLGVDKGAPADIVPDAADVERRVDAPSGASFYVTKECVWRIGLMDESYFLYFEDLDWGLRAKQADGVGYCHGSLVWHVGGASLGSASGRRDRSRLAVYLDFRNRLLFVRRNYSKWFAWAAVVVLVRSCEWLAVGSPANFRAALRGWLAGIEDEIGRPNHIVRDPEPQAGPKSQLVDD